MKPDWKDAPWWADYLAMDLNGYWFWYEFEPLVSDGFIAWERSLGRAGQCFDQNSEWRNTLEQRPKEAS